MYKSTYAHIKDFLLTFSGPAPLLKKIYLIKKCIFMNIMGLST